jgi:hypothetical protein
MTTDSTALNIRATAETDSEITTPGYLTTMTKASTIPTPSIGDQVLFVLDSGLSYGEIRPAIVVGTFECLTDGRANLQVFTDGANDFGYGQQGSFGIMWKTSVPYSLEASPGTWHYATGAAYSMPG